LRERKTIGEKTLILEISGPDDRKGGVLINTGMPGEEGIGLSSQ
jgi:hypothetical protein